MLGKPWSGYYLTAYGIAVKHGFVGTEEDWLASLKGEPGAAAELRYSEAAKAIEWRQEGSETWTAIVPLSELQGELVAATLAEAETAAKSAGKAQTEAESAAKTATAGAQAAEAAQKKILQNIEAYGTTINKAYVSGDELCIRTSNGKTFTAGNVRGPKGDTGDSGVYIGTEEPTDPDVKVWIDPTGHDGLEEVKNILSRLKYTEGGVQVDLADYVREDFSNVTDVATAREKLGLGVYTTEGTGEAYTVTVPGITELKEGLSLTIITHVTSTSANATLNVNGLGAAYLRRRESQYAIGFHSGYNPAWIQKGYSHHVTYTRGYWVVEGLTRPCSYDLKDTVPVSKGGTGNTSVDTSPQSGSTKMVTSNGIYAALQDRMRAMVCLNSGEKLTTDDTGITFREGHGINIGLDSENGFGNEVTIGTDVVCSGTYTGDGTSLRGVTISGSPKICLLTDNFSSGNLIIAVKRETNTACWQISSSGISCSSNTIALGTNRIQVNSFNVDGRLYYYYAI